MNKEQIVISKACGYGATTLLSQLQCCCWFWDVGLATGFSQARRLLLGKASQGAVGVARGRSGPAEDRKADECKIADK